LRYDRGDGGLRTVAWDWVTERGTLVGPGPLWSFADDPGRVQQCPEHTGSSNFSGDPFTGYNYNTSYLGAEGSFPLVGWTHVRRGVPPHACARSGLCAMFGDGGSAQGANKFMRAPLREREPASTTFDTIYSGGQAFRHLGATNVAFVDGHVAPVQGPREGRHATEDRLARMGFPDNGFLSDDDTAYDPR
jgi:prepilin-type processing-associated H-X9-DG protein